MKSLFEAFCNAGRGIVATVLSGRNMKIHIVVATLALILAALLHLTVLEWCIIILLCAIVLAAETFNTSMEAAVDLASPALHEKAKLAKDAAAGAVLLLAIVAVIIGLVLYGNAVLRLMGVSL